MIRVGIGSRSYATRHVIEAADTPNVRFVREPTLPLGIAAPLGKCFSEWSDAAVSFLPTGRSDFYHVFNRVVLNRRPFVVSYESLLPRVWNSEELTARLLARLASDDCRAILAISENARLHFETRNQKSPHFAGAIKKVHVVYPCVPDDKSAFNANQSRKRDGELHLVFVGNLFFQKGGDIAGEAFKRLSKQYPLKFTIVSTMDETNHLFPTPTGSALKWKENLVTHQIDHRSNLSNAEVRTLLATADLLLLPTWDDSFGYIVLEAMAAGVVPIATRIRALPEIIEDSKSGCLIDVPVDDEGRIDLKRTQRGEIETALVQAISNLCENPKSLSTLASQARQTYEEKFSPTRLGEKLGAIYRNIT